MQYKVDSIKQLLKRSTEMNVSGHFAPLICRIPEWFIAAGLDAKYPDREKGMLSWLYLGNVRRDPHTDDSGRV